MSKKERRAYKRGAIDMLFSILVLSSWVVMFIIYGYIKFI